MKFCEVELTYRTFFALYLSSDLGPLVDQKQCRQLEEEGRRKGKRSQNKGEEVLAVHFGLTCRPFLALSLL